MEEQAVPPLTAIDQIANGNSLQMLKAAIPYTPFESQKFLAVYIKVMELENIITFYEDSDSPVRACSLGSESFSFQNMLTDMRNYCSDEQREQLNSCLNLMKTMQMFQTYQNIFSQSSGESAANPMDMIKTMLSPEQQSVFETYSSMFVSNESEE